MCNFKLILLAMAIVFMVHEMFCETGDDMLKACKNNGFEYHCIPTPATCKNVTCSNCIDNFSNLPGCHCQEINYPVLDGTLCKNNSEGKPYDIYHKCISGECFNSIFKSVDDIVEDEHCRLYGVPRLRAECKQNEETQKYPKFRFK